MARYDRSRSRGVAVAFKINDCTMREVSFANPEECEVLVTAGSLPGYSRMIIVIAAYLPRGYDVARGHGAVAYIEVIIREVKRNYRDPFVLLGGDFNQWEVQEAVEEFADMKESAVGPTRNGRCIDRIFTNFGRAELENGGVEVGSQGCDSDHRIVFTQARLLRLRSFEWTTHQYRYYNDESERNFRAWLAGYD